VGDASLKYAPQRQTGRGDGATGQPSQPARQPRPIQFDDDELDVPDFLK